MAIMKMRFVIDPLIGALIHLRIAGLGVVGLRLSKSTSRPRSVTVKEMKVAFEAMGGVPAQGKREDSLVNVCNSKQSFEETLAHIVLLNLHASEEATPVQTWPQLLLIVRNQASKRR